MENKNTGISVLDTFINDKTLDDIIGDKWWTREFNEKDSIERVKLFEKKRLDAKVKCGLELWMTKLTLHHSQFIPYLAWCGMSQPTASRRKSLAELFMIWCEILKDGEKVTLVHVIAGMERVYDKSFKMNDFQKFIYMLNLDNITDSLQVAAGGKPPSRLPSSAQLLGFDWVKVMQCFFVIEEKQPKMNDLMRPEVIGYLDLLKQRVSEVLEHLNGKELIRNRQVASIEI